MLDKDNLALIIRRMEELEYTQDSLAKSIGWSRSALNKFLNQRISASTVRFKALMKELGLEMRLVIKYDHK